MNILVISSVPADCQAPCGARTSAVWVLADLFLTGPWKSPLHFYILRPYVVRCNSCQFALNLGFILQATMNNILNTII